MKIDEKKLKKVVELLYVKEAVGKALYEKLDDYPEIKQECDSLISLALEYEILILHKKECCKFKELIKEKILSIHNISNSNKLYRKSLIFFDDFSNYIDTF